MRTIRRNEIALPTSAATMSTATVMTARRICEVSSGIAPGGIGGRGPASRPPPDGERAERDDATACRLSPAARVRDGRTPTALSTPNSPTRSTREQREEQGARRAPATTKVTVMMAVKMACWSRTPGNPRMASCFVSAVTPGTCRSSSTTRSAGRTPCSGVTSSACAPPGGSVAAGTLARTTSFAGGRVHPHTAPCRLKVVPSTKPATVDGSPGRAEPERLTHRDPVVLQGAVDPCPSLPRRRGHPLVGRLVAEHGRVDRPVHAGDVRRQLHDAQPGRRLDARERLDLAARPLVEPRSEEGVVRGLAVTRTRRPTAPRAPGSTRGRARRAARRARGSAPRSASARRPP